MNTKNRLSTCMQYISFCLLIGCGFAACSDDDEGDIPNNAPYPTTAFSRIELSEEKKEVGVPTVTTTHTFQYNKGRLTTFNTLQSYMVVGEPIEIGLNTNVTYSDHQAVVIDDNGITATYTLNDKGYAVSCELKEVSVVRNYTFEYLVNTEDKHYLSEISESINNVPYSSINIEFGNFRNLHITLKVDTYEYDYIATTPANEEIANVSDIPCLFLADLYPLSNHTAALYGKLLGDPYDVLITQIIADGNDDGKTIYDYKLNKEEIVTSCSESVEHYGSIRTVNYTIK